jgi:serine/threonine protein kinase
MGYIMARHAGAPAFTGPIHRGEFGNMDVSQRRNWMDMPDRSDDQSPDEPLMPTLARGATIRFISPRKPGSPLQWEALPEATESSDDFEFELDDDSYHDEATAIADPGSAGLGDVDSLTSADTQAVDARAVLAQNPRPAHTESHPSTHHTPTRPGDVADPAPPNPASGGDAPRGARAGDLVGGKYLVDGQIGRGGMGRVLRVRHQALGKPFALKLIKAPIATDPRIREMFYREAKLASSLSHENICSIVDFGIDERFGLFMVMELLEGQTLFHRIYHKGRFAPKVACDVIWQIAEALRYIHGQSIIHGDIKSENILLTRTPERRRVPKLLDFGLARANVPQEVGGIEGTPEYLAPERIYGGAPTKASDIYALGLLFYELLAGGLPFRGSIEQVFRMQIEQQVPRVSVQLEGTIDERVDDIIARATAKDPGARHQDVSGFMYELRTLMNMLGMPLPGRVRSRTSSDSARAGRTPSRSVVQQRAKAPAEIFEHAPIPMASVDVNSRVRTANHAFWRFLGMEEPGGSLLLSESPLIEIYPGLLDDLKAAGTLRTTAKQILHLDDSGGVVEVAIILMPAPRHVTVTAGEIYVTLHPLGRVETR